MVSPNLNVLSAHITISDLDRQAPNDYVLAMKELLRTTDPTIIAWATALLHGEGIKTFEIDVHMSVLDGSIGILPRRLMVVDRDLFIARAVLTDNNIPTGQ
jgi:hypothetical protein